MKTEYNENIDKNENEENHEAENAVDNAAKTPIPDPLNRHKNINEKTRPIDRDTEITDQ